MLSGRRDEGSQQNPWRPRGNIQGDGNGPIVLFAFDVSYKVKDDDLTHTTQIWLSGQGKTGDAATSRDWIYTDQGPGGDNLYNSSNNPDDPFTENFSFDHTKPITANIGGTNYTGNGFITGVSAFAPPADGPNGGTGADTVTLHDIDLTDATKQFYDCLLYTSPSPRD